MSDGSGNGTKAVAQKIEDGLLCPISPTNRPEDCRVIDLRMQGIETSVVDLKRFILKEIATTHTLLGFLIDEALLAAARQNRKLKDPRIRKTKA